MRLSIRNLRKVYQDGNVALDDFNIELHNGIFGLLGPNGAGKSTLLEILSLNLKPTSGVVLWEGRDIQTAATEFRRILGYLPQTYGFYPELTGRQMLIYMGQLSGLYGRELRLRMEHALERVNLQRDARGKVKSYSGGMKQRLAIAISIIHQPKLLVIDEPTTGLDPEERVGFRNLLFDLGQEHIVFLSTHIVKDVEFSCEVMTLLYGGRQCFTGRPIDFLQQIAGRVFEVEVPLEQFADFAANHLVVATRENRETLEVRFVGDDRSSPEEGVRAVKPNMEDAYVEFMRQRKAEAAHGVAG